MSYTHMLMKKREKKAARLRDARRHAAWYHKR